MGPTGVGKSDFALQLAAQVQGEIINCDVGQFYAPLSIGTAKPDWQSSPIAHHLFDILSEPKNFSVTEFRKRVEQLIAEIRSRNHLPIIVGGSGFYVNALFFPPREDVAEATSLITLEGDQTWEKLNAIDPVRAQQIDPNDQYRIQRALQIWEQTGILPSLLKPVYRPVSDKFILVHVEREREELYARINARTQSMLEEGWIEEVQRIPNWYPFLQKKRLIGYAEIIDYLVAPEQDKQALIATIQQATRHYAKRQMSFWRMLARALQTAQSNGFIMQANLTLSPVDLYIRQLQEKIFNSPS